MEYERSSKRIRRKARVFRRIKEYINNNFKFIITSLLSLMLIVITLIIAQRQIVLIKMQVALQETDVYTNQSQLSINDQQRLINEQLLEINEQFLEIDRLQTEIMGEQGDLAMYKEKVEAYSYFINLIDLFNAGNVTSTEGFLIEVTKGIDIYEPFTQIEYETIIDNIDDIQKKVDLAYRAVYLFEDTISDSVRELCNSIDDLLYKLPEELNRLQLKYSLNSNGINLDANFDYYLEENGYIDLLQVSEDEIIKSEICFELFMLTANIKHASDDDVIEYFGDLSIRKVEYNVYFDYYEDYIMRFLYPELYPPIYDEFDIYLIYQEIIDKGILSNMEQEVRELLIFTCG